MIAKVTGGGGFRGVLEYLMNEKKLQQEQEKERLKLAEKAEEKERELSGQKAEMREARAEKDALEESEKRETKEHLEAQKEIMRETKRESPERDQNTIERNIEEEKEGRHRVIGGNMTGRSPRELAREFGAFREERPDIKKPVHHASLSAARGEKLTDETWNEIAEKYVERMGFSESPFVVVRHLDTEHDHIHIVTSRINAHGKVISDFQSKHRAEEVMREVEREYSLERVTPSRETERAAPKRGEIERFNRTGELSTKMRLQGHVDEWLKGRSTASEFVENLNRVGVEVIPNLQSTGRVSGISFRLENEVMKGSDLGKGYSWNGLQKRGLEYEPERDLAALLTIVRDERTRADVVRSEPERELTQSISLSPERDFVTPVLNLQSMEKNAGAYLLEQVNPVQKIDEQERALAQIREQSFNTSSPVWESGERPDGSNNCTG